MNHMNKAPLIALTLMLLTLPVYAMETEHQEAASTTDIVDLLASQKNSSDSTKQRELLRQQILLQDLLLKEVGKQGLAKKKEVIVRLDLARRTVLVEAYWTDYFSKHPVMEVDLHETYRKLNASNGNKQYRLSQIFVKRESEIKQVVNKLKQKVLFSELVKEYSQDEATLNRGGDLGWQWKSSLTEPVLSAIGFLAPGDITMSPVTTSTGYVVLKLEEVREQEFPSFDYLRPTLESALRAKAQQEQLSRFGE